MVRLEIPVKVHEDKKSVVGIQYLRGFAAVAVMLCHYGSTLNHHPLLSSVFNKGQLGVHIFFLISGFVIAYALIVEDYHPKKFFVFLFKRLIRINPAYYAAILLTLLTFWGLQFIPSFKGSVIPFIPGQFLAHLFYYVPFSGWGFYNHVFWTLGVEFQFYLIIGLFYFISNSVWFRLSFLMLFMLTSFIPMQQSYYLIFNYAPIFAAGIALMHFYKENNKLYLLLMAISAVLICMHFNLLILILLCITTFVILFFRRGNIKILYFLGRISYSLYITHTLVLVYLLGIFKKLIPRQDGLEIVLLILEIGIAIGFASLFYWLIELPSIRLSKKIAYKANWPNHGKEKNQA
jgi:exopolysaccharide production protein ExoZ